MNARIKDRDQTRGEEIANALSHGFGCLLALAALPILVQGAAERGSAANVVAASLFAGTMIVLYFVSTLYHALPSGRAKVWVNRLDHASIYLFIAGSYLPFLFGVLGGAWGCSAWSGPQPRSASRPSCSTGCSTRCGPRGCMWRWVGWS